MSEQWKRSAVYPPDDPTSEILLVDITTDDDVLIATVVYDPDNNSTVKESTRRLGLLLAAPDLLEACKAAHALICPLKDDTMLTAGFGDGALSVLDSKLETAIAKAEGKEHDQP